MRGSIAMETSTLAFSFFLVSIHLIALSFGRSDKLIPLCLSNSTYEDNSTFAQNLNSLFTSAKASDTPAQQGFYNLSYGENSDQVNAIALCRGDLDPEGCRNCIGDAINEIKAFCKGQKEGIIWYDECMFRYSDRSIFGKMELDPSRSVINSFNANNVSDATQYNDVLTKLLDGLKTEAGSGDSLVKAAAGDATASDSQTIYAAVQCTPDLSQADCSDCLSKAMESLSLCCGGHQGAKLLAPSCNIRYDNYKFYDSSVDLPTLALSSPADAPESPPSADAPKSPPAFDVPASPPADDAPASPPDADYAPASPPSSDAPESPPVDDAPASPPVDDLPASPPADDESASPPVDDESASPPADDESASPPADDESASPPADDVPASPPADDEPAFPPADDEPAFPPADDEPAFPPADDEPAFPPADDEPAFPPADDVPASPPPDDLPAYPPVDDVPSSPPVADVPVSSPVDAVPPQPLLAPEPPPPLVETPGPSPSLETPPPPFFDIPPESPPSPFPETSELPPSPQSSFETPEPPLPPLDENETGKGNMNSRFQALVTVLLLMIMQYFAF